MKHAKHLSTLACGMFLSLVCSADDIYVGFDENVTNDVPAGVTNETERLVNSAGGRIRKTGGGAWRVTEESAAKSPILDLEVQGGTLEYGAEGSDPGTSPKPLEILNQALFWLDASDAAADHFEMATTAGGETYLNKWHDVRETTPSAPTRMYALAYLSLTNMGPEKVSYEHGGETRAAVWFGGHTRGRTMNWCNVNGSQYSAKTIRNIFGVFGFIDSYGVLFGVASGNGISLPFFPGHYGTCELKGTYMSRTDAQNIPYSARFYLNGEWLDPFTTDVRAGWQLVECDYHKGSAVIQNFFNDRNIYNPSSKYRAGGDYISEVLVFTNSLTEAQRLQVEQYLIDKWKLPRSSRAGTTLAVADGAAIQGKGADVALATLDGTGLYENLFDGVGPVVSVSNAPSLHCSPAVRAERGWVDLGRAGFVHAKPGDTIHADTASSGMRISTRRTADAGEIAKDGIESVRLEEIPDGTTKLTVRDGSLAVGRIARTVSVIAENAAEYATVPNASFEFVNGGKETTVDSTMDSVGTYTKVDGWTVEVMDGGAWLVDHIGGSIKNNGSWGVNLMPADGRKSLMLKQNTSAYTTVHFPSAGCYELSFWSASRQNPYPGHQLELLLVNANQVTNVFGMSIQDFYKGRFAEQRHLVDVPSAGDYTFGFRAVLSVDRATLIDKVSFRKVGGRDTPAWRIPGGDFEAANFTFSSDAFKTFSASNTHGCWTLTQTNGWDSATEPAVGLSTWWMGAVNSNYDGGKYFCDVGNGIGSSVQLCFVGNEARASTTFSPPAGRYVVRMKAARRNNSTPKLSGTVQVGTGSVLSIGTIQPQRLMFETCEFPTAFTIADGESVTLTLWRSKDISNNTAGSTLLIVDDVELVPVGSRIKGEPYGNLVKNWSFESGSGENDKMATATDWINVGNGVDDTSFRGKFGTVQLHFGYDRFDGNYFVFIGGAGWAEQEIDFPSAGAYQLRYFTRTRVETEYSKDYMNNWLKAYLRDESGQETELAWAPAKSTNFVERCVLFSIPKAGKYHLGFAGLAGTDRLEPGTTIRQAIIDGVSVVKVDDSLMAGQMLPVALDVEVAAGATLQLDYAGTNRVNSVLLGGRRVTGVIDAARFPTLINGTGALFVRPEGFVLVFR